MIPQSKHVLRCNHRSATNHFKPPWPEITYELCTSELNMPSAMMYIPEKWQANRAMNIALIRKPQT